MESAIGYWEYEPPPKEEDQSKREPPPPDAEEEFPSLGKVLSLLLSRLLLLLTHLLGVFSCRFVLVDA